MKPLIIFIPLLLNSMESIDILSTSRNSDDGIWKMVKSTDGVQTYVRWTYNSEGIPVRERKGEMTVYCSLQDAVRLISDAESISKWMSGVSENYILARINSSEWYTYTLFSVPWPFNKRDLVSLCKLTSDPAQGTANIAMVCKEDYVPMKTGIARLSDYQANWVITKIGEKNIKISFHAISTAPPVFPRYIQDPVIERIFHNILVHLKVILSS
jgi:hypothetical protein